MGMQRLRVEWSGDNTVGPGLTTFMYDEDASFPNAAAVVTFFDAIKAFFPPGTTWTIPNNGDVINELDGTLVGSWSSGAGGVVNSTGTGAFAAGVGARVVWRTSGIVAGRRVRGSTFLVPLVASAYDTTGTITVANLTSMRAAAAALLGASGSPLMVWSRPAPGRNGTKTEVQSSDVPDKVSWLRSRRT